MTLLAVDSSVALARELVRYTLTNWCYGRTLVDESILVMSEIATNAIKAAPGRHIRIRIAVLGGAPLLECWDPAPGVPVPRDAELDDVSGRGLALVAAYAKDIGVRPSGTGIGKVVWALMPA
ncbi:ATP-binding protein [Actinomadura fibrosa]|uniref:ATP-binding protein n=1 Tax=Actinomadura fibrosa TaxID=111802 RepID=A0ABW2XTK8_9ACTN|nr:ATP-binding protein [Actinomadura fibrosa]